MTAAVAGFLISLITSILCGYFVFVLLRKRYTGASSRFLPDRKKLDNNLRYPGAGISALAGFVIGGLVSASLLHIGNESPALFVPCIIFCTMLFSCGTLEDYLKTERGVFAGLRFPARTLYISFCGLVFSFLYLVFGGDSLISMPFIYGAVRTGAFFCPVVTILTVLFCEGIRLSARLEGADCAVCGGGLLLLSLSFALTGNFTGLAFSLVSAGAVSGMFFWVSDPPLLKTGTAGKYLISGILISSCMLSYEKGSLICVFAFPTLMLMAYPVDKLIFKLTSRHIFLKLPADEHLKLCGMNKGKILLFYLLASMLFSAIATASVIFKMRNY